MRVQGLCLTDVDILHGESFGSQAAIASNFLSSVQQNKHSIKSDHETVTLSITGASSRDINARQNIHC